MVSDSEQISVISVGPKSSPSLVHLQFGMTEPLDGDTECWQMRTGGRGGSTTGWRHREPPDFTLLCSVIAPN